MIRRRVGVFSVAPSTQAGGASNVRKLGPPKGSQAMSSAPEFDPLSPAMLANPYPVYAELQEKHPVFWHEKMGAWVVTRYEDCRDVLMDAERFVRDPRRVSQPSSEASASVQTLGAARQEELRRLIIGSIH